MLITGYHVNEYTPDKVRLLTFLALICHFKATCTCLWESQQIHVHVLCCEQGQFYIFHNGYKVQSN